MDGRTALLLGIFEKRNEPQFQIFDPNAQGESSDFLGSILDAAELAFI